MLKYRITKVKHPEKRLHSYYHILYENGDMLVVMNMKNPVVMAGGRQLRSELIYYDLNKEIIREHVMTDMVITEEPVEAKIRVKEGDNIEIKTVEQNGLELLAEDYMMKSSEFQEQIPIENVKTGSKIKPIVDKSNKNKWKSKAEALRRVQPKMLNSQGDS